MNEKEAELKDLLEAEEKCRKNKTYIRGIYF